MTKSLYVRNTNPLSRSGNCKVEMNMNIKLNMNKNFQLGNISWRWENKSSIIIYHGDYFEFLILNESASLIFYLLSLNKRIKEIIHIIKKKYNIPQGQATKILNDLIKPLLQNKVIIEKKYRISHPKKYENKKNSSIIKEKTKYIEPKIRVVYGIDINPKNFNVRYRTPLVVFLEVDYRCNLNCIHCYTRETPSRKNIASFKKLKQIVDKLAESGTLLVVLSGGEPLIRKDIFKIIDYINEKGMKVRLFTNGTLIGDKLNKITASNVSNLTVSLDGSNSKLNDYIRGKGSFNIIIRNIKKAIKKGLSVHLIMTANRLNWYDLPRIYKLSKKLGVKRLQVHGFITTGKVSTNEELLRLNLYQENFINLYVKSMSFFNKSKTNYVKLTKRYVCPIWFSECWVNMRGDVTPCPMMSLQIGNLFENTFKDIWNSNKDYFINADKLKGVCKPCLFKYRCFGLCRAQVYNTTCDIFAGNDTCIWGKFFNIVDKIPILNHLNNLILRTRRRNIM